MTKGKILKGESEIVKNNEETPINISDKMLNVAKIIKDISLENLKLIEASQGLKKQIDLQKLSIMNEINNETNPDGKKKFPNPEYRQAEFEKRILQNKDYQNMILETKRYDEKLSLNDIELLYLDRMFRSYEKIK